MRTAPLLFLLGVLITVECLVGQAADAEQRVGMSSDAVVHVVGQGILSGEPTVLDVSDDGRFAVVVSDASEVVVFEVTGGRVLMRLQSPAIDAGFSRDGTKLCVCTTDGNVIHTVKNAVRLDGGETNAGQQERLIGALRLLSNERRQFLLFKADTGGLFMDVHTLDVAEGKADVSRMGDMFALVGKTRRGGVGVELVRLPSDQAVAPIMLQDPTIFDLRFTPSGDHILVAQRSGVAVVEVASARVTGFLGGEDASSGASTDDVEAENSKRNNRRGSTTGAARSATEKEVGRVGRRTRRAPNGYQRVVAGPEGIVWTGGEDGYLRAWDLSSEQQIASLGPGVWKRTLSSFDLMDIDVSGNVIAFVSGGKVHFLDLSKAWSDSDLTSTEKAQVPIEAESQRNESEVKVLPEPRPAVVLKEGYLTSGNMRLAKVSNGERVLVERVKPEQYFVVKSVGSAKIRGWIEAKLLDLEDENVNDESSEAD